MRTSLRLVLLGGLAIGLGAAETAWAQTITTTPATPPVAPAPGVATPGVATPGVVAPPATAPAARIDPDNRSMTDTRNPGDRATLVAPGALEPGANSFTESQARGRLEDAGFTAVEALVKDDQGFWRGRAMQNGRMTEVAMDFRGRIAAGPNLAALGTGVRPDVTVVPTAPGVVTTPRPVPGTTMGTAPLGTAPPGTVPLGAAPPATAPLGTTVRPDGTPGNPPGTAAGRAVDRATGSNLSGTNPPAPATR